jgi:hypothetical protein
MNSLTFLKIAYAIAWVTYVGYLGRILLRMKKVEQETNELHRSASRDAVPR